MPEGMLLPPEAYGLETGEPQAPREQGEFTWTKEELVRDITNFFKQLDAHEERMRQRMEEEREQAIERARIEAEEQARIEKEIQEEMSRLHIEESDASYQEMITKIKLRSTFEYIVETRAENVAGEIISGSISRLVASDED